MDQKVDQLLDEVTFKIGTLHQARKYFSAQLAPEFRIFDYLRTDEMGLSRCIASLLDPKGKHGQGSVFLDAFLKTIGSAAAWATNTAKCEVSKERQANGKRRIDIYLNLQNGVIGIENKPWASDQDHQLADYAAFIKKDAGNRFWLLLFLSNRDPSDDSIKPDERRKMEQDGQFVRLNYAELIEWLDICAGNSRAATVRIFIEELAQFVREDINGELDMSDEVEVHNAILKSAENLGSAFQIYSSMDNLKRKLLKKFQGNLKEKLKLHNMELDWGLEGWQAYSGFIIQFDETQQSLNLRFEFDQANLNGFLWGIRRRNEDYNNPLVWDEVNKLMSADFGSAKSSKWWPWYSELPNQEFHEEMKNWRTSAEPWISIENESLVEKICNLALRVREVFKNAPHILR
ncbi:MAG: hypothetical protein FD134_494 [Gallionellaceae bacterium]|nr:MAG: hypothetical protein FD134_494 [Gallionellaceae bacterium]